MALLVLLLSLLSTSTHTLDNGVALKPPMGWSTWNFYALNISAELFLNVTDIFISSGMKSVGYEYVNVDAGWWWTVNGYAKRNASGYIYVNPNKYPNGIIPVINYIHSKGLKYGHYTTAGIAYCGDGAKNGSELFMNQDIDLFVNEWKIDMIKVDACHVQGNDTEIAFKWTSMLNATGRHVLFADCRNQCGNEPNVSTMQWHSWCPQLANTWRTSKDIKAYWYKILHNIDTMKGRGKYGGPGNWNDPDMLEVGNAPDFEGIESKIDINRAHFSLWCISSAPLIAGNDLVNMTKITLDILMNKDAIDIDQDYNNVYNNSGDIITYFDKYITEGFAKQYENECIKNKNMTELWYKPLSDRLGNGAIVYLNRDNVTSYDVSVQLKDLPLFMENNHNEPIQCEIFDVWTKEMNLNVEYKTTLSPQSARFLRLSNCIYI
eukprot:150818_1